MRQGRVIRRAAAGLLAAALAVVGLPGPSGLSGTTTVASAASSFAVQGSVEQVAVTRADPDTVVTLEQGGGQVATGTTDAAGSLLFRDVVPGSGYTVSDGIETSDPATVTSPDDVPPQSLYEDQVIAADALAVELAGSTPGLASSGAYGYIETRDGTTLSALASLPPGTTEDDGPFPVLVEYSGYAPSDPSASQPSPTQLAANLSGYAWVGVNLRGTACSGGAFDYFETLQSLDGYDVIEAVAAQDWVDPEGVGMIGISYPGNSQLFVAGTRPPHLSAVAPLSVVADTYRSTLYPGGILNSGFATEWAGDRDAAGLPAAEGFAEDRIADGDTVCEDNQALRLQHIEIVPQLDPAAFYEVARGDALAPWTFVDDVDIPVFLAGTFQDEQTGGHWPTMIDDFASADPLRVVMTNGTHTDPLGPLVAPRLLEFFDLYLKREVPSPSALVVAANTYLYEVIYGTSGIAMVFRDWSGLTYEQALAQYEAEPTVTVLWENGATDEQGDCTGPAPAACTAQWPYASSTSEHEAWPPPETVAWAQRLLPDGRMAPVTSSGLADDEPRSIVSYEYDDTNGSETTFDGSSAGIWRVDATYGWESPEEPTSLSFLTDPMTNEQHLLGSASLDLWIRASVPDVDLEVNLSEVRPDGEEVYIQSGWLRASHRGEAAGSTSLQPVHSHLATDAAPLSDTELSEARVEIFPFAHVLRPGSRLRLTIDEPGGDRPFWELDPVTAADGNEVEVSLSDVHPSRLVLPLVPGPDAPDQLPACDSLRSQPCRTFEPSRAPTEVVLAATGDAGAQVTWSPPVGGGTVEGYEVVLSPGGTTQTVAGGVTTAAFPGLPPGDYTATVAASFAGGDGPASSPSLLETVGLCAPFADVGPTHPFCLDIRWMADQGISTGFEGSTYRPSAPVTRQAMSAFLARLAGVPEPTPPGTETFTDVSASHPFFAEIEWMASEGISTGFEDRTYRPSSVVSRQAMSAFLRRLAEGPGVGL